MVFKYFTSKHRSRNTNVLRSRAQQLKERIDFIDNGLIGLACKNFNIMIIVFTSYLLIVQYIIKQYCRVEICHIRPEWGRRMGSAIISVNVLAQMKITRAVNVGSLMNNSNKLFAASDDPMIKLSICSALGQII